MFGAIVLAIVFAAALGFSLTLDEGTPPRTALTTEPPPPNPIVSDDGTAAEEFADGEIRAGA
ncbi:MAG: hypothetical protein H0U20_00155, partial [Thermoleophilaceae bacterium]|nr:hypothetical protein [Thermoleophilaceae bacterium]